MIEQALIAEVSTSVDADTTRVEVAHAGDARVGVPTATEPKSTLGSR